MKSFKTLIFAGLLALGTSSAAFGAVALQISDGTTTITVADGSGLDLNPISGAVTWVGTIGTWNLNVDSGAGTTATSDGSMDLNFFDNTTAPGNLTINFSQTGFSGLFPALLTFGGTQNTGGNVTFNAFYDTSNTLFGMSTLLGSVGPYSTIPYSGSASGLASGASYSMTEQILIHGTKAGIVSGDANLAPVPEPASLLLLGPALLFAGKKLRKKFGSENPAK